MSRHYLLIRTIHNIMELISFLSLAFVQNAIIGGICVALMAPLVGVTLVSRRISVLGDSLAHVSFAAAILALVMGVPLFFLTVPAAILGSYLITRMSAGHSNSSDALVGILSSVSIALGVFVSSQSQSVSVDVASVLFGSLLTITRTDIIVLIVMTVGLFIVSYRFRSMIIAFLLDEEDAHIQGIPVTHIRTMIAICTGFFIGVAIKIVGALMVSALLIIPAYSALRIARGIHQTILIALLFSLAATIGGIIGAFIFNAPLGPTIVLAAAALLLIVMSIRR